MPPQMEGAAPRRLADRAYLAGLLGVLAIWTASVAYQVTTGRPVPETTFLAVIFIVACMLRAHGLRGSMTFVFLVVAIPYASEFLGVLTGVPYGPYAYTGLHPWLFGLVPAFILVAWINITYLTITTTTLALGRSRLWLAPLDGLVAAAWDVVVDPLAVRAGFWTWFSPDGLYGVPFTNFLGWSLVVTLLSVAVRAAWARDTAAPRGTSRTLAAVVPVTLLGWTASFAALGAAASMPNAAAVALAAIVPVVAAAELRVRRLGFVENPWRPPLPAVTEAGAEADSGRA